MNTEIEQSLKYWDNLHTSYERNSIKSDNWLDKFSEIIKECSTPVLDLGCGRCSIFLSTI